MNTPDWTQPVQVHLHDIMALRLYFNWGQKTVGFGQCDVAVKLRHEDEGRPAVMRVSGDTEAMGREWTRKALHALVDTVCEAMPEHGLRLGEPVDVPIPPEVLAHWAKLEQFMRGDDTGGASA